MTKTPLFTRYLNDDSGATAIEYGLIAALIAVALVVGATYFSTSLNTLFTGVDSEMAEALAPAA